MSAQITVSLSTTPTPSSTAPQADSLTATGYRELAAEATASAATYAARAKRFGEQGQAELSEICHHLAQEALRRSKACAANADFFENKASELRSRSDRQGRPRREVLLSAARQQARNDP